MILEEIANRIEVLSPKGKKLLLLKAKEAIAIQSKNTAFNSQRIVAYVQGNENFSVEELKVELQSKLPDYMVPSQIVPVSNMPLLPNGKIDRKELQKTSIQQSKTPSVQNKKPNTTSIMEKQLITIWEETLGFSPIHRDDNFFEIGGDSILSIQIVAKARKEGIVLKSNDLFENQTIAELCLFAETESIDNNSIEEKLIEIWQETLGFSPIHGDDNFFEIGGDSILSIQIVAKARKEGIILESNHIFEHQTIAELSLFAKEETNILSREIVTGKVLLTPIQRWFFEDHKNAPQYWNQGVRLDNLEVFSEKQIQKVCNYILSQHDALRSKFSLLENSWIQEIEKLERVSSLEYIDISEVLPENYDDTVSYYVQKTQKSFVLSEGSLFKCLYFYTGIDNTNFCLLIAHHLIVDAISWQIITDDFTTVLEKVISNQKLEAEAKTSSIKSWNEYVHSHANNISEDELLFWKQQITPTAALPIDKKGEYIIEEKDIIQHHFSFDAATTKQLQEANQAYNTKVEELVIAAFVHTIGNWSSNHEVTIGFERHGRETVGTELDLSKTVGWFTAYFPVKFAYVSGNELKDQIISVKEKMRSIPNGGIGYGILRYIEKAFGEIENPEIVFNFLGTKKSTTYKRGITTKTLSKNLRDSRSERRYKLEMNVSIVDTILQGTLSYGRNLHSEETIKQIVYKFKEQIQVITTYCNQIEKGGYTPSDFSETEISQDDLDNLLDILE